MMWNFITLLFSFLVLVQIASGSLKVLEPKELITELKGRNGKKINRHIDDYLSIREVTSSFGSVPYGQSIRGIAIYPTPHDGCTPFNMSHYNEDYHSMILLVDRGSCSFATKVYYGQLAGAGLVVIVNRVDQYFDESIFLIDDGNELGENIGIPSMMITYEEGQYIKNSIANDPQMDQGNYSSSTILLATFEFPQSNVTTYQVWLASDNYKSYQVLDNFKQYNDLLGDKVRMVPHYVLWYNPSLKRDNYTKKDPNCYSGGKYCSPDPDGYGPLSGIDIVKEDLNQLCVYNISEAKYWIYLENFRSHCFDEKKEEDDKSLMGMEQDIWLHTPVECTQKALEAAGIEQAELQKCIDESFETSPYDVELTGNTRLQNQRTAYQETGTPILPAFIINGVLYKGNLDSDKLFEAICAAYDYEEIPEVCLSEQEIHKTNQKFDVRYNTKVEYGTIFFIVLILVIFLAFVFWFYKRHVKRQLDDQMQLQVNQAVSQYYNLRNMQEQE